MEQPMTKKEEMLAEMQREYDYRNKIVRSKSFTRIQMTNLLNTTGNRELCLTLRRFNCSLDPEFESLKRLETKIIDLNKSIEYDNR